MLRLGSCRRAAGQACGAAPSLPPADHGGEPLVIRIAVLRPRRRFQSHLLYYGTLVDFETVTTSPAVFTILQPALTVLYLGRAPLIVLLVVRMFSLRNKRMPLLSAVMVSALVCAPLSAFAQTTRIVG